MRLMSIARSLGAAVVAGGLCLAAAPVAVAAPAGGFVVQCQTAEYPIYDWNVSVDATAQTDGETTTLSLQLSDLPGVAPVPMSDLGMIANLDVEVNGVPMQLTGQGLVSFEANSSFAVPPASGAMRGTVDTLNVVIKHMSYDIPSYQMDSVCPPGEQTTDLHLAPITVAGYQAPQAAPSTPEPTQAPVSSQPTQETADASEGEADDGPEWGSAADANASEKSKNQENTEDENAQEAAAEVDSGGFGNALPLVGGTVVVFAIAGWFVFFRKPKGTRSAAR